MSASNDCTVQIWSVEKEKLSSVVLPHPCFIYSCKFCPTKENQYLIFTGAYDGLIRLWSVRKCFEVHPGLSKDPELMCEIDAYQGHILSLCFKILPISHVPAVVAAEDQLMTPPLPPTAAAAASSSNYFQQQQPSSPIASTTLDGKIVTSTLHSSNHHLNNNNNNSNNNNSNNNNIYGNNKMTTNRNHHQGTSSSSYNNQYVSGNIGGGNQESSRAIHTSTSIASEQSNGPNGELVLFSAGSNGTITLWKQVKPISCSTSAAIFDASAAYSAYHWVVAGQIRIPELKNIAINCIKASPVGSKMLVCSRDGLLRMIDYDL